MPEFLAATHEDSLLSLFPDSFEDYLKRLAKVASCLQGSSTSFSDRVLEATTNGGLPLIRSSQIDGSGGAESWEFEVVHGRKGIIATATDGVVIDAASTISIQYSLVETPAAADWKEYDGGLFTGEEIDKIIEYVGLKNRIVWTPNAAEDLNVIASL